jgi:putative lipoprotein
MSSEPVNTLEGRVHYLERIGLAANSTLYVFLEDVSLADAPAKELARCVIPNAETAGLNFELAYRPADDIPGHTYAISARIETGDQLIFISTDSHPVELNAPYLQPLEILVRTVG